MIDRDPRHRLRHAEPRPWDESYEQLQLRSIQRRAQRQARRRWGLGVAGVAALVVGLGWASGRPGSPLRSAPVASGSSRSPDPEPVEVLALDARTRLLTEVDDGGPCYRLQAGAVRVSVHRHEPGHHPVRLRVRDLLVEDVGTVFEVRMQEDHRVEVRVIEGLVRVTQGVSFWLVSAGQQETFREAFVGATPPPFPAPEPATTPGLPASAPGQPATAPAASPTALAAPEPGRARRWAALAEKGDYAGAYARLTSAEKHAVGGVTDLLLAGDVARLTRHPAEAAAYLRRARAEPPGHPLAAMAAFTLGRVLLEELSQPGPAAVEFEAARALGGPLAEDALARAVEAHGRADHPERARQLAEQYRASYPSGRRLRAVRLFGGLADDP